MATTDRATMIRKAITSETDKLTKIVDDITPEGLDMLEESIGEIWTKHKEYHFTRGTDFGHLAVILTKKKHRDEIGDQTVVYAATIRLIFASTNRSSLSSMPSTERRNKGKLCW